jgi:ribosomal protein L13
MSTQVNPKGNGFHGDRRLVIEELDEPIDSQSQECVSDERRAVLVDEGDMVDEVERERGEKQSKGRGRKAVAALVFLLVIGGCAVGAWYVIGNGATRKAKVPVNRSSGASAADSEEAMTRQAIEQANAGPGITLSDGSVVRPGMPPASPSPAVPNSSTPVTRLALTVNEDLSSTVNSTKAPTTANEKEPKGEAEDGVKEATSRGRNSERSVRISEVLDGSSVESRGGAGTRERSADEARKNVGSVRVPSFGSMLPVKSLGVLYTLRFGGLARFELTRDVKGRGWTMPRGTVLVGALRGAEYDRAYVSLVGFIDTESGRFVKISGDLLGSDGGAGIRGKRRKMSSGWSRALSKLGEASLNIAGAFAGSIGRRPIVINDALGSYGGRVSSELDGVLVGRDRNSFVEVAAGSSGYMMITELPDSVQGIDALSKLTGREMEERSNVDQPRRTTGISERELAELIESGDVEQIKEALPRMTPEMRRVAEAVIKDLAGEL